MEFARLSGQGKGRVGAASMEMGLGREIPPPGRLSRHAAPHGDGLSRATRRLRWTAADDLSREDDLFHDIRPVECQPREIGTGRDLMAGLVAPIPDYGLCACGACPIDESAHHPALHVVDCDLDMTRPGKGKRYVGLSGRGIGKG